MRFLGVWPTAVLWSLVPAMDGSLPTRQECPIAINRQSYHVRGESSFQLRRSMLERGPRDERGVARFASTTWKIDWRWEKNSDGGVNIDSLSLACSASILMPHLEANAIPEADEGDNQGLRAFWYRFLARLEAHELNHLQHVRYRAPMIVARLRAEHQKYGSLSTERANTIAANVVREIRLLDQQYDADTLHGRSEGVWEIGE